MFSWKKRKAKKRCIIAGALGSFENGRFRGWAANTLDHSDIVAVEARVGDRLIARIEANAPSSAAQTGMAGNHDFDFLLPIDDMVDPSAINLLAVFGDTRSELGLELFLDKICEFYSAKHSDELYKPELVWGAQILRENVSTHVYENVVYMPIAPSTFIDTNPDYGLYMHDGRLIPEAAYRRGENLALLGQSEQLEFDLDQMETSPYATMVYGGVMFGHYGHFLLTTMSRCWAIDGSYPVLFHSDPPFEAHTGIHTRQLLEAAGMADLGVSFERPTRIRKVIVPETALYEQHSIAPVYGTAMAAVGRHFAPSSEPDYRKVYLSKSKLGAGIVGFSGEDFVDRKLQSAGFTIVHPEQMSIREQLAVFRRAELIVGMAGSAFHTLALAPYAQSKRIILSYEPFINSNFCLLDKIAATDSSFYSLANYVEKSHRENFTVCYKAKNANHLADAIISLVERH